MARRWWQLGLLALFCTANAYAEPVIYSAGAGLLAFHYKEFDDADVLLDREDGILPGIRIAMEMPGSSSRHEMSIQYHHNVIDYDGQTQAGIPARTDSRADIFDVRYLLSRPLDSGRLKHSAAQFGAGFRYWRREIYSGRDIYGGDVSGLLEHYYWPYLEAGIATEWQLRHGMKLGITFRARRMFMGKMMLDYAGSGSDKTFNLGNRWGFLLGVPLSSRLENSKTLIVEPYIEYIDIGASNIIAESDGAFITTFQEPRSTTRNIGVMATIRW